MRKLLLTLTMTLLFAMALHAQDTTLTGTTADVVNLRSGPGTNFEVVEQLDYRTQLTFIGRNQSGTWLLAVVNSTGTEGWLSYTFASVNGNVSGLPVVGGAASRPATTTSDTQAPASSGETTTTENQPANAAPADSAPPASGPEGVLPVITDATRRIFASGQEMGNNADVFSKVGDSITASDLFLDLIGHGTYDLGEYGYLQSVINYFSQTALRDHFSFANTSYAARSGWTTADVLNEANGYGACQRQESPLVCEYRSNKPSIALIMFGTNDVSLLSSGQFQANLNEIVEISIEMGVIPVLSTIPDQSRTRNGERVLEFNNIIRTVARQNGVPLWDYWQALQALPGQGVGEDNVHPSYDAGTGATATFTPDGLRYGYNMRNLTALMVLDRLWRTVIQG